METIEPKDRYTPIRKSTKAARVGNQWFVFSRKLGRVVQLYSDLERDHWILIEGNPDVVAYCEQPCCAEAIINKSIRYSIPDMWVLYKDGREEFIEVKYSKSLKDGGERLEIQLSIQREWAKKNNILHRVVTDLEIRSNPVRIANLSKIINRAMADSPSNEEIMCVMQAVQGTLPVPLNSFVETLKINRLKAISIVCAGILDGKVIVDMDNSIFDLNTMIMHP